MNEIQVEREGLNDLSRIVREVERWGLIRKTETDLIRHLREMEKVL
ncbi:MAG: hypothetical protein H8D26_02665 [Methanomicrobia archaeon]|nr:hypothetical protein [Methanomicrobia archaeon]